MNATSDSETIRMWWSKVPDANIATPDFLRIDVDCRDGGLDSWCELLIVHGRPDTPYCFTPSGGQHWYFRPPDGWVHNNKTGGLPAGIDVRGHGTGYTLLPPSNHLLGRYEWELSSRPEDVEVGALPDWLVDLLVSTQVQSPAGSVTFSGNGAGEVSLDQLQLKEAVKALILQEPTIETDRSAVDQSVIVALLRAGASDDEIKWIFDHYPIGTAGKYAEKGYHAERYLAHSIRKAREFVYGRMPVGDLNRISNAYRAFPPVTLDEKLAQVEPDTLECCLWEQEYGDAKLMEHVYQGRLAYDHSERSGGGWHFWAGDHWQRDRTGKIKLLVSAQVAAQYLGGAAELNKRASRARESDELGEASQLESRAAQMVKRASDLRKKTKTQSVLDYAESLLSVTGEVWDTNQLLLPVANGTVDLTTGELRPGNPDDFIRTHTPIEWAGLNEPCPRFEQFISEIMGHDMTMVNYLQRLLGYGISGLTTEHVFPIFWGDSGRNGKDTLLETLGHVLGPLASSVTKDVVLDAGGPRSSGSAEPHIYDLKGKRLVWASEPKEGARLDAAQVKHISGGGRLKARPLYGNLVEWEPTHLIILVTNCRPHAPADDSALWSRIHMIPFTQRFVDNPDGASEHLADKYLKKGLQEEASGILAWLVRGFLAYRRDGLSPPAKVTRATDEYHKAKDMLGQFIEERCIVADQAQAGAKQLFNAYQKWCDADGIRDPMDGRTFGKKLGRRFERKHTRKGNVYLGIAIPAVEGCEGF